MSTAVFVVAAAPTTPLQLVGSGGNLTGGEVGVPYSRTVTATGGNPPYTYTFGVLPTGLSGNANGTISGTPTAASAGTHTIASPPRKLFFTGWKHPGENRPVDAAFFS